MTVKSVFQQAAKERLRSGGASNRSGGASNRSGGASNRVRVWELLAAGID